MESEALKLLVPGESILGNLFGRIRWTVFVKFIGPNQLVAKISWSWMASYARTGQIANANRRRIKMRCKVGCEGCHNNDLTLVCSLAIHVGKTELGEIL